MAVNKLDSGRIVLSNAAYLHVTPYIDEDNIGTVTYDIVNIVADTLSLTPDDNTVNAKEWEFGDTPLFENITLGKIQFAATCIDFQNEVLKHMFGWKELGGALVAPNSYRDLYAVVEIGFKNEDVKVVVPKLKLNSKAIISTLKTGTGEGTLAGTAYNANLKIGNVSESTPMAFVGSSVAGYTIGAKSFTVGAGVDGVANAVTIALNSVTETGATLAASLATDAGIAAKYVWSDGTEATTGTKTLSSLLANTTYTYGVVVKDADDEVLGSATVTFRTTKASE